MKTEKKYKYFVKNVGILTVCNFSSKILVFLLVPLYTSILTTQEYGTYDLVITTVQLLFPILSLNIVDGVMRYLMDKDADKTAVITIGVKYILLGSTLGAIFIVIARIVPFFDLFQGLEVYVYLYYLGYMLYQFLIQTAKGLEKVSDMGIAGIISTVTMLITNVLFLLVFNLGLEGFFMANIFGQIVPVIYLAYRTRIWQFIKLKSQEDKLSKELLQYSFPLVFTTIGWWVNSASDRYIVTFLVGVAANGLLSVSYKIPSIINTVQGIFIQAWQISAIKEYTTKESRDFYSIMFDMMDAIMVLACSLLIIFTRPIAHILYSNDFYLAWEYVPLLLVSSVINAASGFIGPILSAKKNSKAMALSALYGAISNVVLNFLLVYIWGTQGATVATLISSFIIFVVRKKAAGCDFKISKPIIVYLGWMLIILQASLEVFSVGWHFEIIIIFLIVILKKNVWKKLIKRRR